MNQNNMMNAQEIINDLNGVDVKIIKNEDGLLEKKDNKKIILAEDKRQILFG